MNYLTEISEASLAIRLATLIIALLVRYLFVSPTSKKTSFELVLALTCCLSFFQIFLEVNLMKLFGIKEWTEVITLAWYLSFAASDWLLVIISVLTIQKFNLAKSYATISILIGYTTYGLIQIARYFDRYIFETDALEYVYKNGIPAIGAVVTIIIVWHGMVASTAAFRAARVAN